MYILGKHPSKLILKQKIILLLCFKLWTQQAFQTVHISFEIYAEALWGDGISGSVEISAEEFYNKESINFVNMKK